MPIYEYAARVRRLHRAAADGRARRPCACPYCDTASARVILSAPGLATLPGNQRRAHETNERAPTQTVEDRQPAQAPGRLQCCGPSKPVERTKANPHGLKASPSARPWMISH